MCRGWNAGCGVRQAKTPWRSRGRRRILPSLTRLAPTPTHTIPMSLGTILLIVLILILVGALPSWPHSRSWGYYPSGGLGLVLIILIVLMLTNRI